MTEKLIILNGSPKKEGGTCLKIIRYILKYIYNNNLRIECYNIANDKIEFEIFQKCDRVLIVTPMYVDIMPSHVLEYLDSFERNKKEMGEVIKKLKVYTIIVGGLPQNKQNIACSEIIKNWCIRSGLAYYGCLGIGLAQLIRDSESSVIDFFQYRLKKELRIFSKNVFQNEAYNSLQYKTANPFYTKIIFVIFGNYYWVKQGKLSGKKYSDLIEKLI